MKKTLLLLFSFLFLMNIANAKISTLTNDDFLEFKNTSGEEYDELKERFFKPYIIGAADSFMTSNAHLKYYGKEEIFCLPGELNLNVENFIRFISEQIEEDQRKNNYNGSQPISITILLRLVKIFPCQ